VGGMKLLTVEPFKQREERTEWILKHFNHLLKKAKVLDVGYYEAPLRKLIEKKTILVLTLWAIQI